MRNESRPASAATITPADQGRRPDAADLPERVISEEDAPKDEPRPPDGRADEDEDVAQGAPRLQSVGRDAGASLLPCYNPMLNRAAHLYAKARDFDVLRACRLLELSRSLSRPPATKTEPSWAHIHTEDASWRKQLIGDISDAFVIPRYVKLFYGTFGSRKGQSFFEVGSGNGDMSRAILAANRGQIRRYVVSEYFEEGVSWLQKLGLDAVQADAQSLPCADAEYDAVIDFDVMHHVERPRDMARELMRAGRGRTLLVESNGLSVPRRLLEFTPGHRAAGERSYTPGQYRSFFDGHPGFRVTRFEIYPFLFPFKCPKWFLPALVWFNHRVERIPFFRWQCSSVVIIVDYERE